jgi:hypothetical protein
MGTHMSRKTMKKVLSTLPALALAIGLVGATEKQASAQEVQVTGPLKGAPAVRRLRLYREGRIEFAPTFSSTLLDEYRRTLAVGARINYGITDWLAIGVWGAYGAVGIPTGLSDRIDEGAERDPANPSLNLMNVSGAKNSGKFQKQVASIQHIILPQITAVPFRGKFALFQSVFADVDAYIFAGFGIVGTKERKDCADFVACANDAQKGATMEGKTKLAPTWGLGFNFYISKMVALGVEWRMIPFAWNRAGFDSRGLNAEGKEDSSGKFPDGKIDSTDSTYKFNQMITLSLGFSFPAAKVTD